jgi:dTMP kinase
MNLGCAAIRRPDLCIYLDLTPAQSLERIRRGRDSVEIYENEETLTRVRQAFLRVLDDLSESDRIARVDAYRAPEEIAEELRRLVDSL